MRQSTEIVNNKDTQGGVLQLDNIHVESRDVLIGGGQDIEFQSQGKALPAPIDELAD
jgi:hypothetical protein